MLQSLPLCLYPFSLSSSLSLSSLRFCSAKIQSSWQNVFTFRIQCVSLIQHLIYPQSRFLAYEMLGVFLFLNRPTDSLARSLTQVNSFRTWFAQFNCLHFIWIVFSTFAFVCWWGFLFVRVFRANLMPARIYSRFHWKHTVCCVSRLYWNLPPSILIYIHWEMCVCINNTDQMEMAKAKAKAKSNKKEKHTRSRVSKAPGMGYCFWTQKLEFFDSERKLCFSNQSLSFWSQIKLDLISLEIANFTWKTELLWSKGLNQFQIYWHSIVETILNPIKISFFISNSLTIYSNAQSAYRTKENCMEG